MHPKKVYRTDRVISQSHDHTKRENSHTGINLVADGCQVRECSRGCGKRIEDLVKSCEKAVSRETKNNMQCSHGAFLPAIQEARTG